MMNKLLFRLLLTVSLVTTGAVQSAFAADTKTESKISTLKTTALTEKSKQSTAAKSKTSKTVADTKKSMTTTKTATKSKVASSSSSMMKKININTASTEDLMSIKGIGEAKAKAIVNYRKKNGKFTDLDQLTNVKGIGDGILKNAKSYLKLK